MYPLPLKGNSTNFTHYSVQTRLGDATAYVFKKKKKKK